MKIKRIFAFLVDMVIVSLISTLIFALPMFKKEYENYTNANTEYLEFITGIYSSGSSDVSDEKVIDAQYKYNRESVTILSIKIGVLVLYFGVVGYLKNGLTLGKKIFKIRIVPFSGRNLNPTLFMLRQMFLINLIPEVMTVVALIVCSKNNAIMLCNVASYISLTVNLLCLGFVLLRDDERGLHDIIGNTKVVSIKDKVKDE